MTLPEGAADVNDGNDEKAQPSKGNKESSEMALVNEETQLFTNVVLDRPHQRHVVSPCV